MAAIWSYILGRKREPPEYKSIVWAEDPPQKGDVVVAIDFGTTRSAAAYTIVGHDKEPVKVVKLTGSSFVHNDPKTSTSLLMENDTFKSFGVAAEESYLEGRSEPNLKLFRWFKMKLHKSEESDPLVESFDGGGAMRLSGILENCLRRAKDDVLRELVSTDVLHEGDAEKVFWVLTIPAIWDDHSKNVMRMAAFNAGLIKSEQSNHLLLALEPECAAIASQQTSVEKCYWQVGSKFLIADCGGGTIDITSFEVLRSTPLRMKEVAPPSGGPFGSTKIDQKFLEFFADLIGKESLKKLRRSYPAVYFNLVKEWEEKKLKFRFERKTTTLRVADLVIALEIKEEFPWILTTWNQNNPTRTVEEMESHKVKLSLSFELMKSLFEEPVAKVVETIDTAANSISGLQYVVMAGGFAKCPLLQEKVREQFAGTSVRVLVSVEPDLLIVKGAAMFGAAPIDTQFIESRKSKYTFGVEAFGKYSSSNPLHRAHKSRTFKGRNGEDTLSVFTVHGRVGDDLDTTKFPKRQVFPLSPDQERCKIPILVTENYDVFLADDPGVRELASTEVPFDMRLPLEDRWVFVEFSFGGTEVQCNIYDVSGKQKIRIIPLEFKFS